MFTDLSVNWDLNDWGGRWCLQQQQRNPGISWMVQGWGRKSHCCERPTTALPVALLCRIKESSLWSCWTCSCTCLALLWLCSLLSQPHPNSNHMPCDGVMLGKEPIKQGTRGGQASLVLTNSRKTFLRGSSRKPHFLQGSGAEGSAHVFHWFPVISEGRSAQTEFGITMSPFFCCSILVLIEDVHRWNHEHQCLQTPFTNDSVQWRGCC